MKNKKLKKILKNKKIVICIIILLVIICLLLIKGIFFSSSGSNYGDRLNGIEKISFTKKDQEKIIKFINENEKTKSAKMNIHGKIINILYDVNKDVSIDDAKNIASSSLEKISNEVKGFYDIQFIITKEEEEAKEVQNENGETTTQKEFPIMGYKNSSKDSIVW